MSWGITWLPDLATVARRRQTVVGFRECIDYAIFPGRDRDIERSSQVVRVITISAVIRALRRARAHTIAWAKLSQP